MLRERAIHFQQQAAGEAQLLAAGQSSVEQALSAVHGATGQVLEEVPPEVAATHGGFEEMAARVDALETETTRVVEQADEAEAALQARLEEVETDLSAALADADDLLHSGLTAELKEFEQAIESETVHLGAYFAGECLPALSAKSQELYEVLVQADEDVRTALESAAAVCEEYSDARPARVAPRATTRSWARSDAWATRWKSCSRTCATSSTTAASAWRTARSAGRTGRRTPANPSATRSTS